MDIRKEIQELVALYSLEPELKDVYVEGTCDKNLLDWFLLERRMEGVNVYTVDTINVSDEVVNRYGLSSGSNRSRIIALSEELAAHLPPGHRIICVADRDYEDYLPSGHTNVFLEFTDYTSADLYLLRQRTLRKLLSLVLGGFPLTLDDIMRQIVTILEQVFLVRLANAALGWNMKWVPFTKYVQIDGALNFAVDRFTDAYLQKNNRWDERSAFKAKQEELRAQLRGDPRHRIRGHDLMELLHYAVKKLRGARRFGNVETFHGAFTGCIEAQDLRNEDLFQRVLAL
ncbi:hypothetical protein ES702_05991 [subsurface metagenome]